MFESRSPLVEPSAAMRNEFALVLPDIPLHEGTAEHIPLADDSVANRPATAQPAEPAPTTT